MMLISMGLHTHMPDGFSGSDPKNLCVSAAYHPVTELVKKDKVYIHHVRARSCSHLCGFMLWSTSWDGSPRLPFHFESDGPEHFLRD